MEYAPIPSFLNKGSFRRDGLGYRYAEPPPIDLLSPVALHHTDSWIVVAAALEHAKLGNFSHVPKLRSLVNPKSDPFLCAVCFQLWGDIGTTDTLHILLSFMTNEIDFFVVQACQAALHSGYLWVVPHMLKAWNRVKRQDDRETISLILSEMLEEDLGEISSPGDFPEADYCAIVEARAKALRSSLGTDAAPIWAGRLFGVASLAQDMHQLLKAGRKEGFSLYANFLDMRERFEASTGIDCTSFFSDKGVQASAAMAVLQDFLASENSHLYKEGQHYFFGHEIPAPHPV